jgi:uroporphyrinogen-III decarboxylase
MTDQNFDIQDAAKQVSELVEKISSGKLTSEQVAEAKKTIADLQKMLAKAVKKLSEVLPELTDAEKRTVNAQKFGIADAVINQIFDDSGKILNESEQAQFTDLLNKVLKSAPKREQNKIFKLSDDLKETLYLHNDSARREKLKN